MVFKNSFFRKVYKSFDQNLFGKNLDILTKMVVDNIDMVDMLFAKMKEFFEKKEHDFYKVNQDLFY